MTVGVINTAAFKVVLPIFGMICLLSMALIVVWVLLIVTAEVNLITAARNLDIMRYANPELLDLANLMGVSLFTIVQDKLI